MNEGKIRKFYDAEGKETTPDKALKCLELQMDVHGNVLKETWYYVSGPAAPQNALDLGPKEV